jgi:hypothetical protein
MKERIYGDDPAELAIPNFDMVSEAIKGGKRGEALDFLQYVRAESQRNNDGFVSWIEMLLTYLAGFDEEEILKICKQFFYPMTKEFLANTHGVKEILEKCTASQRRHHANLTVTEETDRYVVRYDPCGSGGRLRRTRDVGLTKKAHPWSWGKAGVPYYCTHCCIHWEIIPAELCGYPTKITLVGDRPEDPCVHLFYKKPNLIPEEYFTRIGMKKDPGALKMK